MKKIIILLLITFFLCLVSCEKNSSSSKTHSSEELLSSLTQDAQRNINEVKETIDAKLKGNEIDIPLESIYIPIEIITETNVKDRILQLISLAERQSNLGNFVECCFGYFSNINYKNYKNLYIEALYVEDENSAYIKDIVDDEKKYFYKEKPFVFGYNDIPHDGYYSFSIFAVITSGSQENVTMHVSGDVNYLPDTEEKAIEIFKDFEFVKIGDLKI